MVEATQDIFPALARRGLNDPIVFFQRVTTGTGRDLANARQFCSVAQVAVEYLLDLTHPAAHRRVYPAGQLVSDKVNELSFRGKRRGSHV